MPPKPKQQNKTTKNQSAPKGTPVASNEDTQPLKQPENMSWKEEYFNPPNGNRFSVLR